MPSIDPAPQSGNQPGNEERYTLLAELGRGGMATAYLAAVRGPGGFSKLVVVKQLRPALASEQTFLTMFLDEAKLAARIEHPNVVHTNEVAYDGNRYFIAMEYIEGQSLDRVIRLAKGNPNATLPLNLHLHIISNMLSGLHFAHELNDFDGSHLGLVHRDVSPHNLMVTYGGHVKLVDFGIAKARTSTGGTMTGVIKGKAAYMPAEQFGGGKNIDRRADIYAAGVMLWQAITGRRLWLKMNEAEIFVRVSMGDVPTPSSVVPVLPELEAIAMKALSLKREDRYATAADFQQALDDVIRAHPELYASSRDLGSWMMEHFAEERASIAAKIEEALGKFKETGRVSNAALVALDRPSVISGSGSGVDVVIPRDEGMRAFEREDRPTPLAPKLPSPSQSQIEQPAKGNGRIVAGAIAATLLAAAGLFAAFRHQAPAKIPVVVSPPDALVYIDGVKLEGDPAAWVVNKDEGFHAVRAEAPGYAPLAERIVFRDNAVSIVLMQLPALQQPIPNAQPTAPTATAASSAIAAPTNPAPSNAPDPDANSRGSNSGRGKGGRGTNAGGNGGTQTNGTNGAQANGGSPGTTVTPPPTPGPTNPGDPLPAGNDSRRRPHSIDPSNPLDPTK